MSSSRRRNKEAEPEVDDLWKIASETLASESGGSADSKKETFTLFVGQKQAGKSSLITSFHNPSKDEKPKPTVALEYLFARRSAAVPNQPKDVAHIWELGGGAHLSNLVGVPLSPPTLPRAVVVVVVDLGQPHNLVSSLSLWLGVIKQRLEECMHTLRTTNPAAADALTAKASRLGPDHPDRHLLLTSTSTSTSTSSTLTSCGVLPVPLVIIANKLDLFKDKDSSEKKLVCQFLRFAAHAHGATLLTLGAKDKASTANLRQTLTHHLFASSSASAGAAVAAGTAAAAAPSVSSSSSSASSAGGRGALTRKELSENKPLIVPAGSDSFEDILKTLPKGANRSDFVGPRGVCGDGIRAWSPFLERCFGPAEPCDEDRLKRGAEEGEFENDLNDVDNGNDEEEKGGESKGAAPSSSAKGLAIEPLVDEARAQRDLILEQYRKDEERKRRLEDSSRAAAQQPPSASSSSSSSSLSASTNTSVTSSSRSLSKPKSARQSAVEAK